MEKNLNSIEGYTMKNSEVILWNLTKNYMPIFFDSAISLLGIHPTGTLAHMWFIIGSFLRVKDHKLSNFSSGYHAAIVRRLSMYQYGDLSRIYC